MEIRCDKFCKGKGIKKPVGNDRLFYVDISFLFVFN